MFGARIITQRILKSVLIVSGLAMTFMAASTFAVPPHPDLLDDVKAGKLVLPEFMTDKQVRLEKGICIGKRVFGAGGIAAKGGALNSAAVTGQFKILAIMVDFSDQTAVTPGTFFDSLLFDSVGNTIHDYFDEVSYGQIDLITVNLPSSIGWNRAPQTLAYYVGPVDSAYYGTGPYPRNSQKLVEDLVDLVDPSVDFSNYDNDNNGYVDILLVIHSGSGAEKSSSTSDIWSHKWSIPSRLKDGVNIYDFTVQPEFWYSSGDMTPGVYAHELAHGFGLPDLYDTDYTSYGIGKWGLMAYGSWNGPSNLGGSPAHLSAWSKVSLGWASLTNVTGNMSSETILNVEQQGDIYRVWNAGNIGPEYYLLENRQLIGYDAYLPGSGLLIWHIDESEVGSGNDDEWWPAQGVAPHYFVSLEQADGLFELEHLNDVGDAADPFPGTGSKTSFNAVSSPSSDAYSGATSFVSIDNINVSGNTVYADIFVSLAAGVDDNGGPVLPVSLELAQNYPNPFNPSTEISFSTAVSAHATLELFNVLGAKVRTLVNGLVETGVTNVTWDGTDDDGNEAASGVYFYRLQIANDQAVKKMVLIR